MMLTQGLVTKMNNLAGFRIDNRLLVTVVFPVNDYFSLAPDFCVSEERCPRFEKEKWLARPSV